MKLEEFKNKTRIKEYLKEYIYEAESGTKINKKDTRYEFLIDLINIHDSKEDILSKKISYFVVKKIQKTKGNNVIAIYDDGTYRVFSPIKAINNVNKDKYKKIEQDNKSAFRYAIKNQIIEFKNNYFCRNNIKENLVNDDSSHVDHIYPKTFDMLFYTFCKEYKIDYKTKLYIKLPDVEGDYGKKTIEDKSLFNKWYDWHKNNAELRIVSQEVNLKAKKTKKSDINKFLEQNSDLSKIDGLEELFS